MRPWKWLKETPNIERPTYRDASKAARVGMIQVTWEWIDDLIYRKKRVTVKAPNWLRWAAIEHGCMITMYITGPTMPVCTEGTIPDVIRWSSTMVEEEV